jgi:starvation-inducible DNA-binding protein
MKNQNLLKILANYYALYVKIHCYHWNVLGQNFGPLHKMFQDQYETVAEEIDDIAERIRMLGEKVPVSLDNFSKLSIIENPNENFKDSEMVNDLYNSNKKIIDLINDVIAEYSSDLVTVDFLTQKLEKRQKDSWFLLSNIS